MSSYYNDGAWSAPGRSTSWEQPAPPSRSGNSSTVNREETNAFLSQFEEVDRAVDNLVKSGKMPFAMGPGRRESMPPPAAGRPYVDYDPRMAGNSRHNSVSEFEGGRPNSASHVQGYYASQRFQPRGPDADQVAQAKRRMAAQRERELRNYHQEQQYNRSVISDLSGAKSDRSMSPSTMTEEERRELIARQHRALYGNESTLYTSDGSRPASQDARVSTTAPGGRNNSPLAYEPFGMQSGNQSADSSVQMPNRDPAQAKDATSGAQRSRANSTSSPSSNPTGSYSLFENAQQSSRTSTSSPGGSPPRGGGAKPGSGSVAPIGTRPSGNQSQTGGNLSKRSTTPLPSPLSYGYSASDANNGNNANNNERSTSASSNPSSSVTDKGVGISWGSNSGVWGTSKNTLGVQSAVWG